MRYCKLGLVVGGWVGGWVVFFSFFWSQPTHPPTHLFSLQVHHLPGPGPVLLRGLHVRLCLRLDTRYVPPTHPPTHAPTPNSQRRVPPPTHPPLHNTFNPPTHPPTHPTALQAGGQDVGPFLGVIFSTFMVCTMTGSNLFSILMGKNLLTTVPIIVHMIATLANLTAFMMIKQTSLVYLVRPTLPPPPPPTPPSLSLPPWSTW